MRLTVTLASASLFALCAFAIAATPATAGRASSGFTALVPGTGAPGVDYSKTFQDIVKDRQAEIIERVLGIDIRNYPNPEIIGGKKAPAGKWPGQVGLLQSNVSKNYDAQFCGGSLIRKRWVLTAAHCVDFLQSVSDVEILTGTQSLTKGGKRRPVSNIWIAEGWDPNTFDNDLAIIKLNRRVRGAETYFMASKRYGNRKVNPGTMTFVTGWGNTSTTQSSYPIALRQVRVPIVSRATCNAPQSYNGDITAQMICAGYAEGGKDACQGDSGGPLLVRRNGEWRTQVGIVSWGIGCAQPNKYGVYTNLPQFTKSVNDLIKNN